MSLLSKNTQLIEGLATKRINKMKEQYPEISRFELENHIRVYFKQYEQTAINKVIEKLLPIEKPQIVKDSAPKTEQKEKKPKQPKKVNRIDPKDERVKGMQLGSYAAVFGGIENKYFWQCAKCERIYQQREQAVYCYDIVGSIKEIQSNNKFEIGQIVIPTLKGIKYEGKVLNKEINESYASIQYGFYNPAQSWYYQAQRQYIYKVEILKEV